MPLSGPAAQLGKDNTDGFNLYLESINNSVAGRQIQVQAEDTQAKPDVDLTKAKQLVEADHVNMLAGINFGAECNAVAPYARDAQVPTTVSGNCGSLRLLMDPRYKSPWLVRLSQTSILFDNFGDYAAKHGAKKAIILAQDSSSIQETTDTFARKFVEDGGQFVQELYTPAGTTDYGPYLSKLDQSADSIALFETGIDGLRFGQTLPNYAAPGKYTIYDNIGGMTNGANIAQLKDKAVGAIGESMYCECLDTPQNQAFLKAWRAKYPNRLVSSDVAQGYSAAQVIVAALQKVNGNVDDKQAFMNALYATNLDVLKGPIKLDQDHDVVQNTYIYDVVNSNGSFPVHLLDTYQAQGKANLPPEVLAKFPFGSLKGKWVGMTKDKLAELSK
jgi:branched-chain amino acid transport system substrate-binding protein